MPVQQLESMTQPCPPESIYELGVRMDRLSQQQALDRIEQIITQRRAGGNVAPCKQVVTLNTEFVMAAQRNPAFRRTINEAALVLPDGIGVVWATHYLGQPAPERVTGTDTLDKRRLVDGPTKGDRKSTRLNSSHTVISYAVFCL